MKKIISLIFVLTLVLSSIQFAFAEVDEDNVEYELLESRLLKSDKILLKEGYSPEYVAHLRSLQEQYSLGMDSSKKYANNNPKKNIIIKITPENREKVLRKYGIEVPKNVKGAGTNKANFEEEVIIIYPEEELNTVSSDDSLILNSLSSNGYEWPPNFYKREVSYGYPHNGYRLEVTQAGDEVEEALYKTGTLILGIATKYVWIPFHFIDVDMFDFTPNTSYTFVDISDAYYTHRTTQMINGNIDEIVASVQTTHMKIHHYTRLSGYDMDGIHRVDDGEEDLVKTSPHYWDTTWINNQLAHTFETNPGSTVYDPY